MGELQVYIVSILEETHFIGELHYGCLGIES